MIKALKRKQSVLRQPMKAMDAGARGRRLLQRREHERYVSPIIPDHLKDEYTPVIEEGKKKCGEGEYYCNDMKKCRPIPKGYRVGYGGMLRPENKEDDSNGKKGRFVMVMGTVMVAMGMAMVVTATVEMVEETAAEE